MDKDCAYFKEASIYSAHPLKGKLPQLLSLDMELTERCNNNCIHCYINLPAKDISAKKNELSSKKIKEILAEAASLGCMRVRFTGGEPLLRDDFEELYIFARKLGLIVVIATNATLITPRLAKLLKRIPPLQKIVISIYGMNKKSYEAVTKTPGSFKAAQRGMRLLKDNKIPFVLRSALLPSNKKELEEFEAFALKNSDMDQPPVCTALFDLRARRKPEDKNRIIQELRLSPKEYLLHVSRHTDMYLKARKEFCSNFLRPPGAKLFSCNAGKGTGCVDAYGYLQPCMLLRNPETVYDLKSGSIKEALIHFFPKLHTLQTSNETYLTRCARCFLKGLCEQCPAKSWMENGTMDTPVEYLCEIAHTEARYLNLLKEDENAWEVTDWKKRIQNLSVETSNT